MDELNCYFDAPSEPNNIHLELHLPGTLDEDAFRAAVGKALADMPRARSRRVRARARFWWQADPYLRGEDLVSYVTCATADEMDQSRAEFLTWAPPLQEAGPVRLLLASVPEGAHVVLNAHHAALDGLSCLSLLESVARAYVAPRPDRVPRTDRGETTSVTVGAQRQSPRSRAREPRSRLGVTRIAAEPAADPAGYGLLPLPPVRVPRPRSGTVNDLLVAALITTVGRWNTAHDRPARNIRVTIPVNDRVPGEPFLAGNHTRLAPVAARWPQETTALLGSVTRQTRWAKEHPRPPVSLMLRALAAVPLPAAVKRVTLRVLLRTAGRFLSDTTLLSNLGNVAVPPRFGDLPVTRMILSAPAHMPRGLSVAAISLAGELQLCVRYRHALFTDEAAAKFADLLAAALAELS